MLPRAPLAAEPRLRRRNFVGGVNPSALVIWFRPAREGIIQCWTFSGGADLLNESLQIRFRRSKLAAVVEGLKHDPP